MPMDHSFYKQNNQCQKCTDGRLPHDIYFYHFNVIAREFCKCTKGKAAFRNWLKAPEVKRAYQKKQEAKIKKALEISKLPARWQAQNIEDIKNEVIKEKYESYLTDFPTYKKQGAGVYLFGKSDMERTRLLTILCLEVIGRYSQACIFLHESQIFNKIQSAFNSSSGEDRDIFVRELENVSCLFIDGFGGKIKSWHCEQLNNILSNRFNKSLPTFFSSFYSQKEYQKITEDVLPKEQQSLPDLIQKRTANLKYILFDNQCLIVQRKSIVFWF